MLGHERPPRRTRPDDPGQPGAGDALGRADAARSAADPYTDSGGGAIDADADYFPYGWDGDPGANTYTTTFDDTSGRYDSSYTVSDCDCNRDTGTVCPAHTGYAPSDIPAVNPDSDPAT
jgi:hypothetical protein